MRTTKTNSERLERVRVLLASGVSLRQASRQVGIDRRLVRYHLGPIGVSPKARSKRSNHVLNVDMYDRATLEIDTSALHYYPTHRHIRSDSRHPSLGLSMIALIERADPHTVLATKLHLGTMSNLETSRFLYENRDRIPEHSVILTDTGAEFRGEFELSVRALGHDLVRVNGWKILDKPEFRGNTKPHVEGLFGRVQEGYLRPKWNELVSLDLPDRLKVVSELVDLCLAHEYAILSGRAIVKIAPIGS